MVAVLLNFELDLHLNLDLNLDSNKLDLGLGLELARGQRSGAPKIALRTLRTFRPISLHQPSSMTETAPG